MILAAGANPSFNISATSAGTFTVSGVISGLGGITKDGTLNPLILTAVNTYSGNTTVKAVPSSWQPPARLPIAR